MSISNDCMWAIERDHALVPCPWCGTERAVDSRSRSVDVGAHLCSTCREKLVTEIADGGKPEEVTFAYA